jgi:hypothetical protein
MLKGALPLLLAFVFASASSVFGNADSRTLIYYFKNITGEETYLDLTYKIPLSLYKAMRETAQKSKVILMDEEGFELYKEDRTTDLWASGVLLKIGRSINVDRILFGSFYVYDGRPLLVGKIFYIKEGLILDVNREEGEISRALRAVESMDVSQIMGFDPDRTVREYNPPFGRILESGTIRASSVIHACVGSLYPLGSWADLYPPGIVSEISVVHFPKINRFPAGLGLNTNYIILRRKTASGYIDSDVKVLAVGGAFQYIYRMRRFVQGVTLDVNAGLAFSNLFINAESWDSVDPYLKIGVSAIAKPFDIWEMTFKIGLFSIDYKEQPIDALYTEIGFLVF